MGEPPVVVAVSADRSLLEDLRRCQAWQVEHVLTADELLARLSSGSCQVVVADCPVGSTLPSRLRREYPAVRLIIVASEAGFADLIGAIREGVFAVFRRPYVPSALIDMVEQAAACVDSPQDIELESALPHWVSFTLSARFQTVDRAVQFIREVDEDLPAEERDRLVTALRELLMNAVEHGGLSDPKNRIRVIRLRTPAFIGIYVQDPGEGFSFADLPHSAISNSPDSATEHLSEREKRGLRPGGFGITLARNLLDGLYYSEKGNEVILIKNLGRS
ncbi:MAG: ATP-binding protein [Bryobacteraceae bacterium]|nr:ATP-binding protein [Bryobacteraceae bacterium]